MLLGNAVCICHISTYWAVWPRWQAYTQAQKKASRTWPHWQWLPTQPLHGGRPRIPGTKGSPVIWLPKGDLDLAICFLLCPHPPPTSLSLPRLRLLTFLNWLQIREVNTATENLRFQSPPSLGIFRLFFLLLAKKILESFKFGFLLSWKLEMKVSQSVMVKEKTGEETGTLQQGGGLWSPVPCRSWPMPPGTTASYIWSVFFLITQWQSVWYFGESRSQAPACGLWAASTRAQLTRHSLSSQSQLLAHTFFFTLRSLLVCSNYWANISTWYSH